MVRSNSASGRNCWDYFWSGFMVWALRLVCYFSNVLFWDSMKGSLDAGLQIPLLSDFLLWSYSILGFEFIAKTVRRKFNPAYRRLRLSREAYAYRVSRERLLITCWIFCGVNFACGSMASVAIHGEFSILLLAGLFGLLGASLFVMYGCVLMVVRNVSTGEHSTLFTVFGFLFLLPPAGYILFMFYYEFLSWVWCAHSYLMRLLFWWAYWIRRVRNMPPLIWLCLNCARQGQIFTNISKRN